MPQTIQTFHKRHIFILFESALVLFFIPLIIRANISSRLYLIAIGAVIFLLGLNIFIFRGRHNWFAFAALATLLSCLMMLFESLAERRFQNGVAFLGTVFFFLIIEGIFLVWATELGRPPHLGREVGILYVYVLSVAFLFVYNLYALRILFSFSTILVFILFLAGFLLIQILGFIIWIGSPRKWISLAAIGTVLGTELFALLYFSPLAVYVRSAIFSIFLYLFFGFCYLQLLPLIDKKTLKTYIIISLVSAALILLVARWR